MMADIALGRVEQRTRPVHFVSPAETVIQVNVFF